MITKLYKLKKSEIEQVLTQKQSVQAKVDYIENEIMFTSNQINSATVNKYGAISDFAILTVHKNTMKEHILKLQQQKFNFEHQINALQIKIIDLQKETEQFAYILEEEKKIKLKELFLKEEEASSEYVQSKYILKLKG